MGTKYSNQSDHDLLVELNVRTESIENKIDNYVRKEEFNPIRTIVYGLVGLILTGVVVALLALVVR